MADLDLIDTIIKQAIGNNERRVYSMIVSHYYDKICEMKTKFFLKWLCGQLDVPMESINLNSFTVALKRHVKRLGKVVVKEKKEVTEVERENGIFDTSIPAGGWSLGEKMKSSQVMKKETPKETKKNDEGEDENGYR